MIDFLFCVDGLVPHQPRRQQAVRIGVPSIHTIASITAEVRQQLAKSLLGRKDLTVSEVAFLLGISEPASFYRAFKAWTGISPAELRHGAW